MVRLDDDQKSALLGAALSNDKERLKESDKVAQAIIDGNGNTPDVKKKTIALAIQGLLDGVGVTDQFEKILDETGIDKKDIRKGVSGVLLSSAIKLANGFGGSRPDIKPMIDLLDMAGESLPVEKKGTVLTIVLDNKESKV